MLTAGPPVATGSGEPSGPEKTATPALARKQATRGVPEKACMAIVISGADFSSKFLSSLRKDRKQPLSMSYAIVHLPTSGRISAMPRILVRWSRCLILSHGLKEKRASAIGQFYCFSGTSFHSFSRAWIISARRDGRIYKVDLLRRPLKRSTTSRSVLCPLRTLRINMPIVP